MAAPEQPREEEEDDEKKPKKLTFEMLFLLYCNYSVYQVDVDNEYYETILLSQIDFWLDQAKLLKQVFKLTETGLAYMKFRKWRLDIEEFMEFLDMICEGKNVRAEEVKELLLKAGLPGGTEAPAVVVK